MGGFHTKSFVRLWKPKKYTQSKLRHGALIEVIKPSLLHTHQSSPDDNKDTHSHVFIPQSSAACYSPVILTIHTMN